MIKGVRIYHISGTLLTDYRWMNEEFTMEVDEDDIKNLITLIKKTKNNECMLRIADKKIVLKRKGEIIVIIFAEKDDNTQLIKEYAERIIRRFNLTYGVTPKIEDLSIFKKFAEVINRLLTEPNLAIKVLLIGEPNTGKTSLYKILINEKPPEKYEPTSEVASAHVDDITQEAEVYVWDMPGKEEFRWLWDRHLKGTEIVLVITDSTTKNVVSTMELLGEFKRKLSPTQEMIGIANKQDLPSALKPGVVGNILGIKTYPLITKDLKYRSEIVSTLKRIVESYLLKYYIHIKEEVPPQNLEMIEAIKGVKDELLKYLPPNHPIFLSMKSWINRLKGGRDITTEEAKALCNSISQWRIFLEQLIKESKE
ncbi:MAG: ADP-ribosylation factor-like protein [Candidatus Odinarchaeia archaeon]